MFDFSAAVSAAQSVVEGSSTTSNASYRYPLVYPQKGQTIVIRPLFNPKSNQIIRKVDRHEKVPCYRSYGQKCPICDIQEQVKDLTGQDPFGRTSAKKTRGICFAQLVSSTTPIETGTGQNKKIVQPGEVILFMHPWSVYKSINEQIQTISQMPTGMDQGFAHADSGLYIQVSVTNDFKYSVTLVPYMSFNPTKMSDADFENLLNGLDDLNEQVIPSTITEEVKKQVEEYADNIKRQYLNPDEPETTAPTAVPYNPAELSGGSSTGTPIPSQGTTVSSDVPAGMPECFKNHNDNETKCVCCPYEVQCQEATVPFTTP